MQKLLIGGSPCTHWSCAQTKNRETKPEGIGWELFKNYLIARDKYNPDYFLYENNKSMSPLIQEQITRELGVEPILINSALLSAQNRRRLYWTNIPGVQQPEDKGILLKDVLDDKDSIPVNVSTDGRAQCLRATYYKDGIRNLVGNTVDRKTCVAIPVQRSDVNSVPAGMAWRGHARNGNPSSFEMRSDQKANAVIVGHQNRLVIESARGTEPIVYEVKDKEIYIKGRKYPIKLEDGLYIIRKLSVPECMRLQTIPGNYVFPVSKTQAYKMIGNGWTCDVIAHILSCCPAVSSDEIAVLSMYDGMSCGRIALNKVGAHLIKYIATEIDSYAIKTTQTNFPDTIHLGDAFQVREAGWGVR